MDIGKRIKQYRTEKKLTQKQLAELSGINEGTIRKYELGIRNPKNDQLEKIAKGLNISMNLFYDLKTETEQDIKALQDIILSSKK